MSLQEGNVNVSDRKENVRLNVRKKVKPLRLEIKKIEFPGDAGNRRVNYGDKMRNIGCDIVNETEEPIFGRMNICAQIGKITLVDIYEEEGIEIGRKLMSFFKQESDYESRALAIERGSFPKWEGSEMQSNGEEPLRNACRLTVAPTGTISMIAGASSGIEPIFSLAYEWLV